MLELPLISILSPMFWEEITAVSNALILPLTAKIRVALILSPIRFIIVAFFANISEASRCLVNIELARILLLFTALSAIFPVVTERSSNSEVPIVPLSNIFPPSKVTTSVVILPVSESTIKRHNSPFEFLIINSPTDRYNILPSHTAKLSI